VKYSIDRATSTGKRRLPLGPAVVKSEILFPHERESLATGTNRIAGVAWAGEERVARVDVSTDGGKTWQAAQLKGIQQPYSWCQWEALWTTTNSGDYSLMARAHTESGQAQPFEYDADNLGYLINIVRPRHVHVAAQTSEAAATFADVNTWTDYMESYAESNTRAPFDIDLSLKGGDGI
jgi:hypothetical protein